MYLSFNRMSLGWVAVVILVTISSVITTSCKQSSDQTTDAATATKASWTPNLVYRWGKVILEGTANDTDRYNPRPTITSRTIGLTFQAMFDAWSLYDDAAVPIYLDPTMRRPAQEHTLENKEMAISYATYRMLCNVYNADSVIFRNHMINFGYDPDDYSKDPISPVGIGNLAAFTVIDRRAHDGANQYGNMPGSHGVPYSDYTGYQSVNTPDVNVDINRWQPKYFSDGKGGKFAPDCLTPHWPNVEPFGLKSADQFRSPPPPLVGSEQLEREVREVIELQANLTPEEKALVEFMRDGPSSVQQSGHWLIFAQQVSVRDRHTLDEDLKMYFLVSQAAMDAFIASWDTKMYYDYARPYALVHHYCENEKIKGWPGPHGGVVEMAGKDWIPYSPLEFLCPPFPSYVSGHSTVSGACAEVLRLYTGSDHFGERVKLLPGALTEPGIVQDSIILELVTFTETAELAGWSRVLGGYHIQVDNIEGLELGRKVAHAVWEKYNYHLTGEKPRQ